METSPEEYTPREVRLLQQYQVLGNHLYYSPADFEGWMLYVPESFRQEVISHYHTDPLYRHPGIQALIATSFLWPNMHEHISLFIRNCDVCARTKVAGRVGKAPLRARVQ